MTHEFTPGNVYDQICVFKESDGICGLIASAETHNIATAPAPLSAEDVWYTNLITMPRLNDPVADLTARPFASEKDAIQAARKLRIAEVDRLQLEINALDARYEQLEDEAMKKEG